MIRQEDYPVVYMIRNKLTGKFYIGSSINPRHRWAQHKTIFNMGGHSNPNFQADWDSYGESNFEFIIMEKCREDNLLICESEWMEKLHAVEKGYNSRYLGELITSQKNQKDESV